MATAARRASKQQQGLSSSMGTPAAALELEETTPLNGNAAKACKPFSSSAAAGLDSYSHPLVLESDTAFKALIIAPLVIWWLAIGAGIWVYEGLPKGQRVYHVMLWFDTGVLRPAGALVPFVVLLLRAAVHGLSHMWQKGSNRGVAVGHAADQQQRMQFGSLLLNCLVVYVAMAAARVAIYLTHFFLLHQRYLEFHIVSDHIFLAATMLICLHAEIICLMSDMLRCVKGSAGSDAVSGREIVLTLLFVVALFLYLFTAADMYYTAKYFHFPLESFSTTVIVFILFQLPVLVWLIRQRRVK